MTPLPDLRQRLQTLITELPEDSLRQIETLLNSLTPTIGTTSPLEHRFQQLATQWKQETRGLSSTTALAMHPAYQQIIGMGKAVIPLLLQDLETKFGRWFWALKSITGQDPVPAEHQGNTQAMTEAWLTWGRDQGYQ
jgi:hypothetical protein